MRQSIEVLIDNCCNYRVETINANNENRGEHRGYIVRGYIVRGYIERGYIARGYIARGYIARGLRSDGVT